MGRRRKKRWRKRIQKRLSFMMRREGKVVRSERERIYGGWIQDWYIPTFRETWPLIFSISPSKAAMREDLPAPT